MATTSSGQTKTEDLIPYANNARTHDDAQISQIAASIEAFGFNNPVLIDKDNGIIAGHGRVLAAKKLGMKEVPTICLDHLNETQKKAYILADNKLAENAGWDSEILSLELESLVDADFDLDLTGFSLDDIINTEEDKYPDGVAGSMVDNFGQPPFSVLDTRKADWQEKKRAWRDLINDMGESREGVLSELDSVGNINNNISLLDPVMAELMVRWFGMENGRVFDPFAGDSVFGYVAGTLGMSFEGIELRAEQSELNSNRCRELPCIYYTDTSENMDKYIKDDSMDLIFSCPPYADLEVYSDNKDDLSNMSHGDFFRAYDRILTNTYAKLKNNRFAVIVMGEVRDKKGFYIGTIQKTIEIMQAAGYRFYNEIVLINSAGTLPLRAGKYMRATRKIGKMHQNILVFSKGDPKQAADDLGEIRGKLDFEVEDGV